MSRTSLLVTALVAFGATHVGAQDHTWTADRPDGVAPAGVFADRVLDQGDLFFSVNFRSTDREGIRFGTDFLSLAETFEFFSIVPLTLSTNEFEGRFGIGLTDGLTFMARGSWLDKSREQITADEFFITESEGFSDIEAQLLWEVWSDNGVRAHLHGGVNIPTASVDETASVGDIRSGIQPYDMQTGARAWGLLPGLTVQMQNEVASVGAQVTARIFVDDNFRGYRPGDQLQAEGWAAYRFNDVFSVSGRIHVQAFEPIDGRDPALDPSRDPGEVALSFSGERVDLPLGLNIMMPKGPLAGHRLSVEWINNIHEDLDGPWLAADDSFVFSWQTTIGS